jgi:hypothetical protein
MHSLPLEQFRSVSPDGAGIYQDLVEEYDLQSEETIEPAGVPASDRVVQLDHNSATYLEADAKLTEMVAAVRSNNEYAVTESEDYEQSLAELESGQRLLKEPRVRLDVITSVLITGLQKMVAKFGDALLGALATVALTAIAALLGIPHPSI